MYYYIACNGINLWSIEFTIKYIAVITERRLCHQQGTETTISPTPYTDKKPEEKRYKFEIENRSPNINVYLFLGVEIFKIVRPRHELRRLRVDRGCSLRFNFRCRDKICVDVFDSS